MPIYRLGEKQPALAENVYVAAEAAVIGDVTLAPDCSVWAQAVLRGDNEPITIEAGCNIQEAVVMHTDPGYPLHVGRQTTVGHQAMLHGCRVGSGCLIGIQAVVLNGAEIGSHCLVAAGALITEGKRFPDRSLILGAPARVARELESEEIERILATGQRYVERAAYFRRHLARLD